MADRRGVFMYWLGFKRALEWALQAGNDSNKSKKKHKGVKK